MARSDSCEVHSGVYRRPGAYCDEDCGFGSLGGALDNCDRYDCWQATVVAFGMGPNLTGTGYGTSSQPGLLRGARMSGSTDTWDVDGDRVPDSWAGETPGYPVVFSGDVNGNGVFDTTTCTGNACSGDAF